MLRISSLILQSALYILAGLNHFRVPRLYLKVMPAFLPFPMPLIFVSGTAEIVLAIMPLFPPLRKIAFILIAAMLVVYVPVHIYLIYLSPFKLGSMLVTPQMAWIRLVLQVPLIIWALWQGKII